MTDPMPPFRPEQIAWLRRRYCQPMYTKATDLAECNYRAGRASVVQEIENLSLAADRPTPSALDRFNR